MTVDFWHLRATVFTVFYFLSYRMWKNSCQQNEHCHAVNTYIAQVRQRRFAQEESKVYLAGPGQAHRSPLVYDLCGRLILVVCAVETAMQDSFFLEKTGWKGVICNHRRRVLPCQWWFSASSCTDWSLTALSADFVLLSKTHNATSCGSASTWLKCSETKTRRRDSLAVQGLKTNDDKTLKGRPKHSYMCSKTANYLSRLTFSIYR